MLTTCKVVDNFACGPRRTYHASDRVQREIKISSIPTNIRDSLKSDSDSAKSCKLTRLKRTTIAIKLINNPGNQLFALRHKVDRASMQLFVLQLQDSHKSLLWNFNIAHLLHAPLAFLLFFEQLLLSGNVTPITF